MSPDQHDRRELESLLGALREQTLEPEEAERLRDRLRDDKTARRELIEQMMLVASLRDMEIPVEPADRAPAMTPHVTLWQWRVPLACVAATMLAVVIAAVWLLDRPTAVGVLARQEACVWSAGQLPLAEGEAFRQGSLRLDSGLAELQIGRSVTLVLEGPANLDVQSASRCFLHYGRVVVRVEKEARGFILDGPGGRIVDHGTEFGVSVDRAGGMEVHVLEGRVTAQPAGAKKAVELGRSESMQWSAASIQRGTAQPLSFVTDLPIRTNRRIGYVHWSFDEATGEVSKNRGRGLGPPHADGHLHSALPEGPKPEWISGQFGAGLRFHGETDFVECNFDGIAGGNPRTVAFWVKVPRDIIRDESYGIVSWGTYLPGSAWQLSVNWHEEDGETGPLRAGILTGAVVGNTDLRDDRWHHVAVVMYGGRRPDISTHVLLYVDGRLERTTTKAVCEVHTDTSHESARRVRLGRSIEAFTPPTPHKGFFRGCMDEVFIFDAALTQKQIEGLFWHNRLPDEATPAGPHGKARPSSSARGRETPRKEIKREG
jgi:ferric-dicitrate binding protein FerR (iron transport regulator)